MYKKIVILFILLLIIPTVVYAGDWEFQFFGINTKDFEGRSFSKIVIGCVTSFVVHEAGHLIAGEMVGMDTSMKWDNGPVVWADDYYYKSDYEKALYHGGGFLAQLIVGGTLTAIPYTRHSDFAVGFNGLTSVHNVVYGLTGGRDPDSSDVKNLDKYGYNGKNIAIGSGIVAGVFTYINLDKEK
jgi:hypothetical protein